MGIRSLTLRIELKLDLELTKIRGFKTDLFNNPLQHGVEASGTDILHRLIDQCGHSCHLTDGFISKGELNLLGAEKGDLEEGDRGGGRRRWGGHLPLLLLFYYYCECGNGTYGCR